MLPALGLLLAAAPLAAQTATDRCPVPRGTRGFEGGLAVCWSDPKLRVGLPETLSALAEPAHYDLLRYGNPLSLVALKPHASGPRLLMRRGELVLELDSMQPPAAAVAQLDRHLGMAADVWSTRHEFLQRAEHDDSLWLVSGRDGGYRFTRLEGAGAEDDAAPPALSELSDEALAERLAGMAPVRVDGRRVRVVRRNLGKLLVLGRPEDLFPEARKLYDELTGRFERAAALELEERRAGEAGCAEYCYDPQAGEYLAREAEEPGAQGERPCRAPLRAGGTCGPD